MPDETLTCRDCGTNFVFSESEQQFFRDRGYENKPSRCPDCRRAARGGGGRMRSQDRERQMTEVTCSSCGKTTEVPFVPTPGRAVYCPDCYAQQRAQYGERSGGGGGGGQRRY